MAICVVLFKYIWYSESKSYETILFVTGTSSLSGVLMLDVM